MIIIDGMHIETVNSILRSAELNILLQTNLEVRLVAEPKQIPMPTDVLEMLGVIAKALDMTMDDYYEKSRKRYYVDLRCIAAVFINRYYSYISLKETGDVVGGMDHTSIINYRTRAKNYLQTGEPRFLEKYSKALKAVETWAKKEA